MPRNPERNALDRASLERAISESSPCGRWLRREPLYADVKEASRWREADPYREIDERPPDWGRVEELCANALATETKDLYLACLLLQARAARHGALGLEDGLWLLRVLHERYWTDVYPQPRADGSIEGRLIQLEALVREFETALGRVPLVPGADAVTLFDWKHRGAKLPGGEPSPWREDTLRPVLNRAPAGWFEAALEAARGAQRELAAWEAGIEGWYGAGAPSTGPIRAALEELEQALATFAGWQAPVPKEAPASPPPATSEGAAAPLPSHAPPPRAAGSGSIEAVLESARDLALAAPGEALAYLVPRIAHDQALPLEEAGAVPLAAPPAQERARLRELCERGDWERLLHAAEDHAGTPLGAAWLDLQRYSALALFELGAPHAAVRPALVRQLALYLDRRPWLTRVQLADGTPGADETTRAWIEGEVRAAGAGRAAPAPASSSADAADLAQTVSAEARALLEREDFEAAAAHFRAALAAAPSERDHALLSRALGALCLDAERPELAAPVLEGVRERLARQGLERWEGDAFVSSTLSLLFRAYSLWEARSHDAPKNRRRAVAGELARYDLPLRLELEASTP